MATVKAKTLNDNQQRLSLSGSKNSKGLNRSIRNVLAKPYEVFWPLADPQSEAELSSLLDSLLPAARKLVLPEDRHTLRKIQGEKMKDARAALAQKIWANNPGSKDLRRYILFGVNDVARGLETDSIASVLISNEADPPILTRHLATLAVTRNVPHIVLQNLKECTRRNLDFASLAIGIKSVVAEQEGNHFHALHLKVGDTFRKLALEMTSEMSFLATASQDQDQVQPPRVSSPANRSAQDIYLKRSSRTYRVFVPGQDLKGEVSTQLSQYISLSGEVPDKQHVIPLKSPLEPLGSENLSNCDTYHQKVRLAKTPALLPTLDLHATTEKNESVQGGGSKIKRVERYFNSLQPLKVKKIQSNPSKIRKKIKKNTKKNK